VVKDSSQISKKDAKQYLHTFFHSDSLKNLSVQDFCIAALREAGKGLPAASPYTVFVEATVNYF